MAGTLLIRSPQSDTISIVVYRWVFDPLNLRLPFFAQYISLFVVGVMAYRQNWFLLIPDWTGKVWLWIALGAIVLFPILLLAGGAFEHLEYFEGGLHWQAFVYALWESVVGVGMCIGLLVFFRRHVNHQGRWAKVLTASAYTAYLIHGLVTVSLAYAARDIHLSPLLKFALAVLVAVPLCFVLRQAAVELHAARLLPLHHARRRPGHRLCRPGCWPHHSPGCPDRQAHLELRA